MAVLEETRRGERDVAVISLVGVAHYTSHVLQLALPPLFPILHVAFGVSFTELGAFVTLFYAASGLGQAAAGVLVDRYGAPRLLAAGLVVLSGSILLAGFAPSYGFLLPLAPVAGLGNSVFHPADLSILSHRISEGRLGRAYAVHGVSGSLGYATSPVAVTLIAGIANWHVALVALGLGGLAVGALLLVNHRALDYDHHATTAASADGARRASYLSVIGAPVVLMAFGYFAMTSFAGSGMQTFSITALTTGYGLGLDAATRVLTLYLLGAALGMVGGGFLADRVRQHHRVAMSGIAVAALLMLTIAAVPRLGDFILPVAALAGIANGITGPSRDVLVRRAAAGIGTGSVFGFVYSGFDLGSSTAPLLFGMLLDQKAPQAVFLAIACAFALGVPTVMRVSQRIVARPQPAEAD
ncbi:MAG TPA: MFS transporter [Stellaceae bacterium]|jgi:MFS family permease|nr:MFS transporter [Stellaceae bacterium]